MNREIATIDNQMKQSLDMFNTGNFLALGEYDDENLNDDLLLPELIISTNNLAVVHHQE